MTLWTTRLYIERILPLSLSLSLSSPMNAIAYNTSKIAYYRLLVLHLGICMYETRILRVSESNISSFDNERKRACSRRETLHTFCNVNVVRPLLWELFAFYQLKKLLVTNVVVIFAVSSYPTAGQGYWLGKVTPHSVCQDRGSVICQQLDKQLHLYLLISWTFVFAKKTLSHSQFPLFHLYKL